MSLRPLIAVKHDPEAWDDYVSTHPEATQYHQYAWLEIIQKSFGHRVIPLAATAGDRYVGVLPLALMDSWLFGRFMVSLPCVNYAGLLADTVEVEQALWNRAAALANDQGAAYLEARHLRSHPFVSLRRQHKVTMVLDMASSSDCQWRAFNFKIRNHIRKAQKSALELRMGGAADIPGFYEVFSRNMRDLGTPVYSQRFFEEVFYAFPRTSWVFSVLSGGTVIAAGIGLAYRDTLEVPWSSSRREYRSLCPNNLLFWGMIQHAIKEGFRRFDFGRSTPGEGPYRFKEQWGARPVPLSWEYSSPTGHGIPDLSPSNSKYHLAIELWKRLPLALTRWLGPAIVKGIP